VESLPEADRRYLDLGDALEQRLIHQDRHRTLEDGMRIGWELLRIVPASDLGRLSEAQLARHGIAPGAGG
jgi:V/A-type H+-transporting ATPase subunit B